MALESRKKQAKKPTPLPKDFIGSLADLFNQQFEKLRKDAEFLVYADLFLDEVVLCVSLTNPKSLRAGSFYLSADLPKQVADNPEKVTEKLKSMIDLAASWFAQSLAGGDGLESVLDAIDELKPGWEPLSWEGETVFVRVNRDNQVLENEANRLLADSGFKEEEEELNGVDEPAGDEVADARNRLNKLLADISEDDDDPTGKKIH